MKYSCRTLYRAEHNAAQGYLTNHVAPFACALLSVYVVESVGPRRRDAMDDGVVSTRSGTAL